MAATYYERANKHIINRLLASEELDDSDIDALHSYRRRVSKRGYVKVDYNYSKGGIQDGRLFADGGISLQSFRKKIRHTLAKDIYFDIDMSNAGPTILSQYCERNNIQHNYLDSYVKNREGWLKNISRRHGIPRDESKKLIIRLLYLGSYSLEGYDLDKDTKLNSVIALGKELRRIGKEVARKEHELYNKVCKIKSKNNKVATTLTYVVHIIENRCLQHMVKYFERKGYKVGSLCFDGLLVEKKEDEDENIMREHLEKCMEYVSNKEGYRISLEIKEMDETLDLPEFGNIVESDREVQEKLFVLENKDYFKTCNNELYVFDDRTGMYEKGKQGMDNLNYYILKHEKYFNIETSTNPKTSKLKSYGKDKHLLSNVSVFVRTVSKDNKWLERAENSSRGYLLFSNGIYNMKTGEFREGFDHNIVFFGSIPHKFNERNEDDIEYAKNISFGLLLDDYQPLLVAFARALSGINGKSKEFYFCPGKSNAGKSKLMQMFQTVFGQDYIRDFDASYLSVKSKNDSKDEAASMRWAYLARHARIIFSNEIRMNKIDGNIIKKIASGGDNMVGREHGGNEQAFKPHFTAFCMLNDIPQIDPLDQAVYNRLRYCEFNKIFVANPQNPGELKADDDLDDKIQSDRFVNGFTHLVLDAYKYYLEHGQPEFDETAKERWTIDDMQKDNVEVFINNTYEITNNKDDIVPVASVNEFKKAHAREIGKISPTRFREILENMGAVQELTRIEGKKARVWRYLREKENPIIF